jgi:tRNA pseudouridine13 synthase
MIQSAPDTDIQALPFLTLDTPGVGGAIKSQPEDFVVEEIPLYEAAGEGTHLYLTIEKRGVTTSEAIARLARAVGRPVRDFGFAGMKDAAAITRQRVSVEHVAPEQLSDMDVSGVRILSVERHRNKLKLGHLSGNRFEIRLRDVETPEALDRSRHILNTLTRRGLPNFYGPQRFGSRGDNWMIGRHAVQGRYADALGVLLGSPLPTEFGDIRRARELYDAGRYAESADAWPRNAAEQRRVCRAVAKAGSPNKSWRAVDRNLRRLFVSAYQSHLFNRVLTDRMLHGAIDRIETGDLAYKHDNGACFTVEDAAIEQPRCDAFDISPTGPIFGKRTTAPLGAPGEREAAVLQSESLDRAIFSKHEGKFAQGGRRPLRVPVGEASVESGADESGSYLLFTFTLPPGAYATTLLREVTKRDHMTDS